MPRLHKSTIECAALCLQNVPCKGYHFDEAQSLCLFIDGRIWLDLYSPLVDADQTFIRVMVPPRLLQRGDGFYFILVMKCNKV